MNKIVSVTNLHRTYRFGDVHALQGINLDVRIGEFVAIKGRSGSGKTTLLNIIGSLDTHYTGAVLICGKALAKFSEKENIALRRSKVGFVFQSFGLLPHFSSLETVDFALRLAGYRKEKRRERSIECLTQVGLEDRLHNRPDEMSGGQQQRLCIARAIVAQPILILADEPTGELDSKTGRGILSLFRQIVEMGNLGLIVATHDPLIDEFATVIYELNDGRLTEIKRGAL
jgi:ABC-type lipoprotein export system ATPase subunit